ncbi:SRPBCC family protein [Nocardia colli]|uniref:SRPBCC family protein n=1 Tax=Nocardia colli TaxID=2545717 RepID=A0A5N0EJK2_9NOCA|nr:SRPBCC family protein [Nocardia colli]KAA8889442.1 SRPBCC family protein [Nocardia colli]
MGAVSAGRAVSIPAVAQRIWPLLGEPEHHPSWLTLHRGFDSEPPARLRRNDCYCQQLSLLGRSGSIAWMVTELADNMLLELTGTAAMRVRITLRAAIEPGADASTVTLRMHYDSPFIPRGIAETLCKATEAALGESLDRLRQLVCAGERT